MDLIWFIGIGGVSLVAILQHFNHQSFIYYDKMKIEEHKIYSTLQTSEIIELKLISNRHLFELEWLRKDYTRLKKEQACAKVEPDPKYKEDLQQPIFQKMFKKGRNALIKEAHPDHGGSREQLEEVEAAFEVLKNIKPVVEKRKLSPAEESARMQRDALASWQRDEAAQSQRRNAFSNPYFDPMRTFYRGY